VKDSEQGVWNQFSTFLSVSDADLDPMVRFEVQDMTSTAGSGILYANGAVQAQGAAVTVNASDLTGIYVQGGSNLGPDTIQLRAYDGFVWSDWTSFTLNTRLPNRAPVLTPTAANQTVQAGLAANVGPMMNFTDADGDSAFSFELWDAGAAGGHFRVGGVQQAASTLIPVTAAQLATTEYVGGAAPGSETVYARAYDGQAWSGWTSWSMGTLA
jgi:hypothetical protein